MSPSAFQILRFRHCFLVERDIKESVKKEEGNRKSEKKRGERQIGFNVHRLESEPGPGEPMSEG